MRRGSLLRAALVGLGLLPGLDRAFAQGIQVTPVQVELTAGVRTAVVTVQNLGSTPVRLQISAFAWSQDARGEMRLARTKDLTFFPGLLTVAAGQKRNLRVAAAAPFGEVEKTYRLFVEQLPEGPDASQTAVRVLTRVGIPVYLEPPRPSAEAGLSPIHATGRRISFVLRNTGNVRIRPRAVKVTGADEKGVAVFEQPLAAWYLLAGDERIFETEVPAEACRRARTVTAEVQLEKSTLRGETAMPDGACGP